MRYGFTLLELLVALAVFSIMAGLAYRGLESVLNSAAHTEHYAEETHQVQWSVFRLSEDLSQYLPRSIRDEWGQAQPGLVGSEHAIEFTRAGHPNPLGLKRSTLLRVRYSLENNTLRRSWWQVLDRAPDSQAKERVLLSTLDDFQLRYWDQQFTPHAQWPPLQEPEVNAVTLQLIAVEFLLFLPDWGEIRRLVPVITDKAWYNEIAPQSLEN